MPLGGGCVLRLPFRSTHWFALVLVSALSGCDVGPPSESPTPRLPARAVAASEQPSILLVTIDTLRADHVGAYGYPRDTTPNLDRLASEGAVFEVAYAPTGATCPSHATLFTSRSPLAHGLVRNGMALPASQRTLAEILHESGYLTAAFVSSYPLKAHFGFAQGFEFYDDDFTHAVPSFVQERWEGRAVEGSFDRPGERTVDRALAWLERQKSDTPVFVWLHLFDPHAPYRAPGSDGLRFVSFWNDQRSREVALYDGEIRYADAQMERLRAGFERWTGGDETLVVVTSDHGEGLQDHGWWTHNRYVYEEEVRIPLVLRWPGRIAPGLRLTQHAQLIDLAPTILALIGLDDREDPILDADLSGHDLSPLLRGESTLQPPRSLWLQRPFYKGGRRRLSEIGWGFGVRRGRWKYIEALGEERRELYDLATDSHEQRNLAGAMPARVRRLSSMLADWREREVARAQRSPQAPLSPVDKEALRALGYVE